MDDGSPLEFLNDGGEMGERMRAFDWSSTDLGPAQSWPQSLKTIVRVMLDSRFAMWMSWGPNGTFFCNDAYLPTVGIKRDWVLGARSDVVWEEIWHDIGPRIDKVLTTGKATWDQALQLFLRRSGEDEETFHTFSYSPVYDDSSRVAGMLCVVVEDTERVLAERRLGLLRDLASASTGKASSIEDAGKLLLATVAAGCLDIPFAALYLAGERGIGSKLIGTTADAPGREVAVFSAFDHENSPVSLALGTRTEQLVEGLDDIVRLQGAWAEPVTRALVIPLTSSQQVRPLGCVVLGVSTRRPLDDSYRSFMTLVADQFTSQLVDVQSRLEAQKRAEALAELDRAKSLFFSNVSHEFRTPLTLLLGPIDNLVASKDVPVAIRDELALAQRNGLRLKKLVNSLLDFSRIEAGRVETQFRPTDLAAFTADLAAGFRSAVEAAGMRLEVRIDEMPEVAYVDRDMWEKVVLNLLSNAFKFTFEGGIEVVLGVDGANAKLTVRDTGVGIDEQSLHKIFDRFHRVVGARSRTHEGTGIGLALVKELVKLHGGSVSAASEVGKGSTFTVLVPLGKAHLPAKSIVNDTPLVADAASRSVFVDEALRAEKSSSSEQPPANGRATLSASRSREHILVVDDNTDMREYVRKLVGRYWRVTSASDGEEALSIIARDKPDLVITDMMMPNLDGRGLIQHIRTNPATESLPVLVLSAQAGDEARVAGLQQGADDYLVKPFSARELLARIEVQLLRSRVLRTDEIRNRRLAEIFREAPVGVALLKGPDHVYEFTNAVHTEFLAGRGVIGLPIRLALPELHGQGIFELLDSVYASGKTYKGHSFPIDMLDSESGQLNRRYFEFVYQPLWDDSETPTGIAVVGIDVTELMSARLRAEAANRTKDEFMAILGHELRNPLAPIFAALELMKRRTGDPGVRERQIIERQVRHMVRLVDDLLDVSRIARGTLELKLERLELSTVVERAVETAAPLFEKKRQTIEVDVPAQGLELYGDAIRLCQVVSNLLTNASKFTDAEGLIAVKGWRDQEDVVLSIRDSGIGLEAEELGRVFGLFEQGQQELHRPQGGLGLGLAIAKSLATAHGGSIAAHSAGRGLGSEFTLRLPRYVEEAAAVEPGEASSAKSKQGRRVLLVDDSVDVTTLMAELLEEAGYEVLVAPDGPTALALVAEEGPIDVALLDIRLPRMDGYELALHLRRTDAGKAIRLVAMSGYGEASHRARAETSGFDSHLVKPVDIQDLITAVEGRA